jgi:hypothetical protein
MVLGIDFDNTIVCYDDIFHNVAAERGLIPSDLPQTKDHVRNHLRSTGQEDIWTEMQGYVYGGRMSEVKPFPGAIECIDSAVKSGIDVRIISHKTRKPYMGHPYDLHSTARHWMEMHGFFDPALIGMKEEHVYFLETKQKKLEQIRLCGCKFFIDDLPELFLEDDFPDNVERILFDPANSFKGSPDIPIKCFSTWMDIRLYLKLT